MAEYSGGIKKGDSVVWKGKEYEVVALRGDDLRLDDDGKDVFVKRSDVKPGKIQNSFSLGRTRASEREFDALARGVADPGLNPVAVGAAALRSHVNLVGLQVQVRRRRGL